MKLQIFTIKKEKEMRTNSIISTVFGFIGCFLMFLAPVVIGMSIFLSDLIIF